MNTSKIIKAVVGGSKYTVTAPILKEDYGIILQIEGVELPESYQVDFSNDEHNGTSVTMIGNADGVRIPKQFIDTGRDVFAFLYWVGEDYGKTVYKFRIPNKLRPDRTNAEPTPEEQSVIDQTISALNDAVDKTETNVEHYPIIIDGYWYVWDAESSSFVTTGVDAHGLKGDTGECGEKGDKGDRGEQGVQGIQGERGPQGEKGDKGDKGDTGATGAQGIQGVKGDTGADGISPTVTITPITGGHRITITDADGEHSADVMNGVGSVDDVQINGQSIVSDGVANIPMPKTVNVSGTTPTITAQTDTRYVCGEVATLDFTPSATGICDVVFTSGSTPTVVTLPSTVNFPDGAFTAEADTTYEINILDGIYGAVMAWT